MRDEKAWRRWAVAPLAGLVCNASAAFAASRAAAAAARVLPLLRRFKPQRRHRRWGCDRAGGAAAVALAGVPPQLFRARRAAAPRPLPAAARLARGGARQLAAGDMRGRGNGQRRGTTAAAAAAALRWRALLRSPRRRARRPHRSLDGFRLRLIQRAKLSACRPGRWLGQGRGQRDAEAPGNGGLGGNKARRGGMGRRRGAAAPLRGRGGGGGGGGGVERGVAEARRKERDGGLDGAGRGRAGLRPPAPPRETREEKEWRSGYVFWEGEGSEARLDWTDTSSSGARVPAAFPPLPPPLPPSRRDAPPPSAGPPRGGAGGGGAACEPCGAPPGPPPPDTRGRLAAGSSSAVSMRCHVDTRPAWCGGWCATVAGSARFDSDAPGADGASPPPRAGVVALSGLRPGRTWGSRCVW